MDIDIFLITWGIPTFMVIRAYLKMDNEEKMAAMKDFKKPHFIFTIGFLVIGAFFATLGNTLTINIINDTGIVLLMIAGIVSTLGMWRKNKLKSIYIFILISISILFLS